MKKVDPVKDFEEPTRLHRKDPKNLQFQMSLKELEEKRKADKIKAEERAEKRKEYIERTGKEGLNDEEIDAELEVEGLDEEGKAAYLEKKKKEEEQKRKEEEAERQMQLIAPDGGARKKKTLIKNRTKQIKVYNEAKRKLRYEEFYPWVLEDYDANQAWVSNYEAGNNENYCLLILDSKNKCFKLAPVEKFYKLTSRNKYATLTLEEAEAKMKQGSSSQRWLMRKMLDEATTGKRVDLRYRKMQQRNKLEDEEDENERSENEDDLDYEDEFQDDEEAPIMEGPDEEKKLIESKMKKEMLSANNLIEKVPVDGDDEDDEFDELFDVKKEDKESKKLRMALSKNAMNEVYASDDDDNPYLSDSDIDSEDEKNKDSDEIKVKKENDEDEIKVKQEEGVDEFTKSKPSSPKKKKTKKNIYVENYQSGFIKIKATKQILSQFPKGEWNPRTAIRRDVSEQPDEPVPESPNRLTVEDIDKLLANGPIGLPHLVKSLRNKIEHVPNAKQDLRQILKEHFVLKNKQVHRKT